MNALIVGLVIFFGVHFYSSFRSRAPGKDMREKLGYGPFMGLVSLAAIIGLGLIIWGYGQSRPSDILYQAPTWGQHLNLMIMWLAMILLVSAYAPTGYIKEFVRHPMLMATALWGIGHLLSNGELNSVLLFGSFLAFAVVDRVAVGMRSGGDGPNAEGVLGDVIAFFGGSAAFAAIVYWLHPILFGVVVLP